MTDEMPEKIWVRKNGLDPITNSLRYLCRPEPYAHGAEYRRADLPKEVDLKALRKPDIGPLYRNSGELTSVDMQQARNEGWNDCLDHLVTIEKIKDKGM